MRQKRFILYFFFKYTRNVLLKYVCRRIIIEKYVCIRNDDGEIKSVSKVVKPSLIPLPVVVSMVINRTETRKK